MIRINLASRKRSAGVGDPASQKKGPFGLSLGGGSMDMDDLRDLPIKKIVIALVACVVGYYFLEDYKEQELAIVNAQIQQAQAEQSRLQAEVNKTRGYEAIRKQLDEDERILREKIDTIKLLISDRNGSYKILHAFSGLLPEKAWIKAVALKGTGVEVAGAAADYNEIADLLKRMQESAYFTDVALDDIKQESESGFFEFAVGAKRSAR